MTSEATDADLGAERSPLLPVWLYCSSSTASQCVSAKPQEHKQQFNSLAAGGAYKAAANWSIREPIDQCIRGSSINNMDRSRNKRQYASGCQLGSCLHAALPLCWEGGGLSSSTLMTFLMSFAEEAVGGEEFVLEMD